MVPEGVEVAEDVANGAVASKKAVLAAASSLA
jgi:hypothetical protein